MVAVQHSHEQGILEGDESFRGMYVFSDQGAILGRTIPGLMSQKIHESGGLSGGEARVGIGQSQFIIHTLADVIPEDASNIEVQHNISIVMCEGTTQARQS